MELQKCGCRLFVKSSACCSKSSSQDCELRIGDSKMIDCSTYGKPKYGLSGNTETSECKTQRMQSECWHRKDLVFGAGHMIGPCRGSNELQDFPPSFVCPKGQQTVQDFHNKKCGPTPEDCGCTLVEECSSEGGLKCYRDWKASLVGGIDTSRATKGFNKELDQEFEKKTGDIAGPTVDRLKNLWR